jgi:N-methylhydantoinase B
VHITNTSNLPVEAIEMEYPLLVESYGFVKDSGGAGEFRGGMGLRRVISTVGHTCDFNGAGERFRNQPWGIFGGAPGASGHFQHVAVEGAAVQLEIKPAGIRVGPGEKIVVETPGAGGYGKPSKRDPQHVEEDRRSEKFSAAYLAEYYGGGD